MKRVAHEFNVIIDHGLLLHCHLRAALERSRNCQRFWTKIVQAVEVGFAHHVGNDTDFTRLGAKRNLKSLEVFVLQPLEESKKQTCPRRKMVIGNGSADASLCSEGTKGQLIGTVLANDCHGYIEQLLAALVLRKLTDGAHPS